MTQVIQQVNLNLIPQVFGANSVLVPCSQYDKSYRVIQFNVYNGRELYSIPSTCTVIIRGTKKDNTGFEYNCEFSGSQVIFPLEPQITVLSGKVPAELRIVNGEELIGSANFLFMVEPSPLTDDTIISETQLPLLEEALQAAAEAEQSRILAEAAKESAEDYAMSAGESAQSASQSATNASVSEANARTSEQNAKASETNAKESEDLAKGYAEDAQGYASSASDSADSASQSAQSASQSAQHAEEAVEDIEDYVTEAQGYAEQSHTYSQNASVSASNALTSENNAHTSEVNAKASEDNAKQSETNASASATQSANSASQASQSASNASTSATNSANSATASANSATQSADSATQASQSATSAEESATEAQTILDNIDSLIEHKANDDGIYPNMSVGSAEKLLTSETVDDEFTYQTLKHDGYARINSIKGNTIVWNQLVKNGNFADSSDWVIPLSTNGTLSIANNEATVTPTTDPTTNYSTSLRQSNFPVKVNHKYLLTAEVYLPRASEVRIESGGGGQGGGVNVTTPNVWTRVSLLWTRSIAVTSQVLTIFPMQVNGGYVTGDAWKVRNFNAFDLTAMGLDSLTADQFRSLYPLNYYQYNAGELLSFNGAGIKIVGFNQWDEEWEVGAYNSSNGQKVNTSDRIRSKNFIPVFPSTSYYKTKGLQIYFYDANYTFIGWNSLPTTNLFTTPSNAYYMTFNAVAGSGATYANDICISLSSDKNGTYAPYTSNTLELPISQYFPNGMRSAGNVYDELTRKKAITRVGSVDLGTLTWAYNANYGSFISYGLQGVAVPPATSAEKGNITSIYPTVAQDNNTKQKGFSLWRTSVLSYWNNGEFADLNAFLSAMNGVMMTYELKTPTETDIDIDLTYMIVSGGTEQLLPINTDVPVTSPMSRNVSFFYDSNVVANLLTLLSSVAQVETSPTTHAYSVGDYLIYNYQLYKVNSAIAVGATLTVGTNIVATTLIDVIKSL